MTEIKLIGVKHMGEFQEIVKKTELIKKSHFKLVFAISLLMTIVCLFIDVLSSSEIIVALAITASLSSGCVALFTGVVTGSEISAQRFFSHPKDAYSKYLLSLYQLIAIVNEQILRYNIAYRSVRSANPGHQVQNEDLENVYKVLQKKTERIFILLGSLDEIKKVITDQESSRMIAELSYLALSEIDQADPLIMAPINCESLTQEIEREQEVLASFHELDQNE